MAGTLQLGGITVLEESGGTVTAPNNLSVTGTISGTIGSTTTFPTGVVIKKTYYSIGRGTNTSASFPNDDTIPQRSEGTEIYSQAYTPSTTNCTIIITTYVRVSETSNINAGMQLGLFISDMNDALVVGEASPGDINPNGGNITIMHSMSGWSGEKTFSLRSSGGNCFNFSNEDTGYGAQKFGSAFKSAFIVEEVAT